MKLQVHENVIDFAEERRAREQPVLLAGWRANTDMLTPYEIAALRQRAKERSAFYRKAFAHLKPVKD